MNIKEAKQQIKNAIIAYSTKDAYGHTLIPVSKQRPIFLLGAPGIWENGHHGTNRSRIRFSVSVLFNDTPHASKCFRSSVHHG